MMNTEGVYLLNATKSGNYGSKENTFTSALQTCSSDHLIHSTDTSNRRQSIYINDPFINSNWPRSHRLTAIIFHMNKCAWFIMMIGFLSSAIHGAIWPVFVCVLGQFIERLYSDQAYLNLSEQNQLMSSTSESTFSNGSNLITEHNESKTMNNYFIALLSLMAITFVTSYLQSLCWQFSFERQIYTLHQDFFYQLLRQDADWLCAAQENETLAILLEDLHNIGEGISIHIGSLVEYSSTITISLTMGFFVQWKLMGVIMCTPIVITLCLSLLSHKSINRSNELLALSRTKIDDAIERIRSIAAWMAQHTELLNYQRILQLLLQADKSRIILNSMNFGLVIFLFYASFALLTWYGIYLKQIYELQSVEDMYVVIFSALAVMFSITRLDPCIEAIAKADTACSHIFPFITTIPVIDSYSTKGKTIKDFQGHIKFRNVSFTPTSEKSKCGYMHHANFELKPNTITAIVEVEDHNTCLLKFLLSRLYDPMEGQIFFDEYDLKSLNIHWLRGEIGLVEESPIFLSESLIDNILGGLDSIQFDDVVKAAKVTFAHEIITSLPRGYGTVLSNASLSPEEKQIISMTRIMLQNPKIVIIEELEKYDYEDRFKAAVKSVCFGRTVLMFSKQDSTLKKADHIVMFQDGWVVSDSSYEEFNQNGNFDNKNCKTTENNKLRIKSNFKQFGSEMSNKDKIESLNFTNIFKFLHYCKSEIGYFIGGIIFALLFGLCAPIYAFLLSRIFYLFLIDTDVIIYTIQVVEAFLILAIFSGLTYSIRHYLFQTSGLRAVLRLRSDVFDSILHQQPSYFDKDEHHQVCALSTILTDSTLSSITDKGIGSFISSIVAVICGIVMATLYCWPLTIIMMLGLVSCLLLALISVSTVLSKVSDFRKNMNEAMQIVYDAINNLCSIQMLRLENKTLESFVEKLTIPYFMYKKQIHIYSLLFAFHQSTVYFFYLITFIAGDQLIKEWLYEPKHIFTSFLFLMICGISLTQLMNQWNVWRRISKASYHIFQLFDIHKQSFDFKKYKNGLQPDISGKITFQNVHLNNDISKLSLSDFTLTIEAGQLVAIDGKYSGELIFNLLVRFNEPSSGQVLLDGINIGLISVTHLRENCNLICKPLMIPGTLYQNIAYGLTDPFNPKHVETAAVKSGVTKFLWSLSEGWNTDFQNKEDIYLKVSDQFRVALARCHLRNPKIVLVADIFNELPEKEIQEIFSYLQLFCKNRTCIICTSNQHILKLVDQVISLKGELILKENKESVC